MSDFEVVEPPRSKRRGLIGGIVLGLLAAVLSILYARGTVAETTPRPAEEKPVCHLLLLPDGSTVVRGARLVAASPDEVWAAVTDYEHFKETFPFLRAVEVTKEGPDRFFFKARVNAHVEEVEYAVRIEHVKEGDARIARWEGQGGRFAVNRGSWRVEPANGKTLVEYRLELVVKPYPTWIVRNVLLSRIPLVLAALDQHVKK